MENAAAQVQVSDLVVFAGKAVGHDCLRYLLSSRNPVSYVVVAHESDDAILSLVREAGVPHHIYTSREHTLARLGGRHFRWLLNLWSSHILPPELLRIAEHRLNIHPSYAPHCLGSDSATWAIREGVTAGVSLLEMEPGIDRGGVFAQQAVEGRFPETGKALFERLKQTAVDLFCAKWPAIQAGHLTATPQTPGGSYHTTKMTRADRSIDGSRLMTAEELVRWALAHDFAPLSTAEVAVGGARYRLTITLTPCPAVPAPTPIPAVISSAIPVPLSA